MIEKSPEPERILGALGTKICLTAPFKRFDDNSIYKRHDSSETPFQPLAVERAQEKAAQITDFVPKPRYTRKELKAFCDRNIKDGVFRATAETVQSVEDLENCCSYGRKSQENRQSRTSYSLEAKSRTRRDLPFQRYA